MTETLSVGFVLVAAATLTTLFYVVRWRAWAWNLLVIWLLLFIVSYLLTGTPRSTKWMAIPSRMHGDAKVLWHASVKNEAIYLLVQQPRERPIYLTMAWSGQADKQMKSAEMQAMKEGVPLEVDIDKLSKGDVEGPQNDHGKGGSGKGGVGQNGNADSAADAAGSSSETGGKDTVNAGDGTVGTTGFVNAGGAFHSAHPIDPETKE
jgi:hypothetical protein